MKYSILFIAKILLIGIISTSCQKKLVVNTSMVQENNQTTLDNVNKKPKNIILLIGDGMGLSQVSASLYFGEKESNFEKFSVIGLCKTSSSSDLITDSAAASTAIASGIKTYNGAIGVTSDSLSIKTIVEQISPSGISTGLISTSSITHATPASFYAHVTSRSLQEDIAAQLVTSEIDFFAGGGIKFFNERKDKQNLMIPLKEQGFEVSTTKLPITISDKKQAILLSKKGMPTMEEGRGDFLPNATKLALEYLSKNEEGFFLMVEGSQIDWGGHDKNGNYLITELIDFDKAIGVALDFAQQNEETLVIVTADHETGGFTLSSKRGDYNEINPAFSTDSHSATMVPVFAKGPGSELFGGIYENTGIYEKMVSLLSR